MMSECKKPLLDKSQRTCFTCGGDHLAANCPSKRPPLKAVTNDASRIPFYNVNDGKHKVDVFGFAVVEKGAKPRPQPQPATLGMHLSNAFLALSCPDEQEEEPKSLLLHRVPAPNVETSAKAYATTSQKAQKAERALQISAMRQRYEATEPAVDGLHARDEPASAPGQTSMSRHVSLPTGWQSQGRPLQEAATTDPLVACQVPPQRRGPKTCTTALNPASAVNSAGESAGPKHLLHGISPPQCASIWSPHPSTDNKLVHTVPYMPHKTYSKKELDVEYPSLEAVDDLPLEDLTRLEDDHLYSAGMQVVQQILHEMSVVGRTRRSGAPQTSAEGLS